VTARPQRLAADLGNLAWPVQTGRLRIRPATVDDAEATWGFRKIPEVSNWLTAAPDTFDDYLDAFRDQARLASTLIIEMPGVGVIGDLMLAVGDGWAQHEAVDRARRTSAELGWAIHPSHGGLGLATEAVTGLLRLCFEELAVRRVTASCFAANDRSWRLMERVGMRREGNHIQESLHRSGSWLDTYTYALLVAER
jgi:RimJ/RimL family protein N-acetyltransferase